MDKNRKQRHIRDSINLPASLLLDESGKFLEDRELAKAFLKSGVDTVRPVVTYSELSCPSTFVVDLALRMIGCEHSKVFLNW